MMGSSEDGLFGDQSDPLGAGGDPNPFASGPLDDGPVSPPPDFPPPDGDIPPVMDPEPDIIPPDGPAGGSNPFDSAPIGGGDVSEIKPAEKVEPKGPSALDEWRRQRRILIESEDQKEVSETEKMRAAAAKQLEDKKAEIKQMQEDAKKRNLEEDKETMAMLDNKAGNQWENVAKHAELEKERSDLHQRDVTRMRALLFNLKHG